MAVNVAGALSVAVFFFGMLATGLWASWKERKRGKNTAESVVLAGRNIGVVLGTITLLATWADPSVTTAASEMAFSRGILWCQAPIGYGIALIVGGMFFAKPVRERGYITSMDVLQEKYGNKITILLILPSFLGDILWLAGILASLGAVLSVILDIDSYITVISSAALTLAYTFLGGMYSVAFTDAFQLISIAVGMALCVPFIWNHPAVNRETLYSQDWMGTVEPIQYGSFIDNYLFLIFGSFPCQAYMQRVLSMKTARDAQVMSIVAGFLYPLIAIPAMLIGGLAKSVDWMEVTNYEFNSTIDRAEDILPLALEYLTPSWISFIGLGAMSAAILSSADSIILGLGSVFAHNIFKIMIRPQASNECLTNAVRISMVVVTVLSSAISIATTSLYGLVILASDLIYALLLPQVALVLHFPDRCNKYGCIASFIIATVLRCLCGVSTLGLPAVIELPLFSNGEQNFPFRTAIMLTSCFTHLIISHLSWRCFASGWLDPKYDVLRCCQPGNDIEVAVVTPLTQASK